MSLPYFDKTFSILSLVRLAKSERIRLSLDVSFSKNVVVRKSIRKITVEV